MEKISAVYKVVNTVTGDFYIGSSVDVKRRWSEHKVLSTWKRCPNNLLYQDMQKYGLDKFEFLILSPVEPERLRQAEQELIETMKPTYNNNHVIGINVEKRREYDKNYTCSDKRREYNKKYYHSEKRHEYMRSEKYKEARRKYNNKLCLYNGETLTINALANRLRRDGIPHSTLEAKKYLIIVEDKID